MNCCNYFLLEASDWTSALRLIICYLQACFLALSEVLAWPFALIFLKSQELGVPTNCGQSMSMIGLDMFQCPLLTGARNTR